MKLLMAANVSKENKRYNKENMEVLLKAQIENSIELGWRPLDILIVSNMSFEFMKVRTIKIAMNNFCYSGSKMFALKWYMNNHDADDLIWSKDLDCWQNVWFDPPKFKRDVGISTYSNGKFNGGSIFWKPKAQDLVDIIISVLVKTSAPKEEPTLNKILKHKNIHKRVQTLDYSYNVGCSGFVPRYERAVKPIKVCHFNPQNSIAWEIHGLDRCGIGEVAVTLRLERLLRKYYTLATELREKKK